MSIFSSPASASTRRPSILSALALAGLILILAGCSDRPAEVEEAWNPPAATIRVAPQLQPRDSVRQLFPYEPGFDYTARVRTDLGEFTIQLLDQETPETVAAFISLANYGQYNDNIFFSVSPDAIVYTGDAEGFGIDSPGQRIRGEFTERDFVAGTVGMFRRQDDSNSATGLWFITLRPHPAIKGKYAAFGQVVEGLEVVQNISRLPTLGGDVSEQMRNRPLNPPKILEMRIARTKRELTEEEIKRLGLDQPPAPAEQGGPSPDM